MREDWIEVALGEIFQTVTGNTPSKKDALNYGNEVPFIKPPELENKPISKANEFLSSAGAKKARILPEGSVLITCIGNLGRTGLSQELVAINQQINAITPLEGINSKFTFYQCQSLYFRNSLEQLSSATTLPIINKGKFNTIRTQIAPLPEQRAIVAKIEQLFSELDNGVANLKAAKDKLEIFRQAVLKKAFEGELTKNSSHPKDWKQETLGNVIERIEAGKSFRCEERPPQQNETGILKVSAVTWGEFQEEESKTVMDESKINPAYFVQKGDFLLSRANTLQLVGNTVIVRRIQKKLMLSDKTLRISFNSNTSDWFILYFLRSHEGRKQIEALSTGNQVSMRNIGQARIKQIKFPCPPTLEEQTQIVQEIETRLSVCDNAIANIEKSLTKSEALRQSILKKAFAGKLLTNAELQACRQEPDWEPAAKLLERIKHDKKSTLRKKSTT